MCGCVCVCVVGGGVLISGSFWYSRTSTSMLSGCNVECTPNMDSNKIVWNNVDCMDLCKYLASLPLILLPDPTFVTSLYGIPLAHNSHALSNSSAIPVGLRSHLGSKNN